MNFYNYLVCLLLLPLMRPTEAISRDQNLSFVETAPFTAVWGHVALSGERQFSPFYGVNLGYSRTSFVGERTDYHDYKSNWAVSCVLYSDQYGLKGLFLHGGFEYESSHVGRVQPAGYSRTIHSDSEHIHDKWVNHDSVFSAIQSLGYRIKWFDFLTASVQIRLVEPIFSGRKVTLSQKISETLPTQAVQEKNFGSEIKLNAGVYF